MSSDVHITIFDYDQNKNKSITQCSLGERINHRTVIQLHNYSFPLTYLATLDNPKNLASRHLI